MAASRPLIPKSGAEKVNGFFYAAVAMTTIGAFMFGVGLYVSHSSIWRRPMPFRVVTAGIVFDS